MNEEKDLTVPGRYVASVMLFLALIPWPYGYYQILRWVVCGVCAWSAFHAVNVEKQGWAWTLGITAVLFNPITPIHLPREFWILIDIGVGITLIISLKYVRRPPCSA